MSLFVFIFVASNELKFHVMGDKKKQPKAKEPVRIRFKNLTGGNKSVYLDLYNDGSRAYEFLKQLYIIPERTQADKEANNETMRFANAVKAQRIVELQNGAHGFTSYAGRSKMRLLDYVKSYAEKKKEESGGNERGTCMGYMALHHHLKQYSGDKTTFRQVDKAYYCTGFIEYLKTAINTQTGSILNVNTQFGYMKKFETILNAALSDGIISRNPFKQIKPENKPQKQTPEIEYLTIDEIRRLVKTPCVKPVVKQAFLFACFSGLRFSDIKKLKWGDIRTDSEGRKEIKYTQQKTGKHEYLQVSDEALKFLPEQNGAKSDDRIFSLFANGYVNQALSGWTLAAGITKRVTFHVSRHTNATLLLSLGVPIETVSKLLGHSDIQTTQIYAKVIDRNKRNAVSKLDGLTD